MIPLFTSCLSRGDKSHRSFQLENSFHEKASSYFLEDTETRVTYIHTYVNTHIRVTHFRIEMKEEGCNSFLYTPWRYHGNKKIKKKEKEKKKKGKIEDGEGEFHRLPRRNNASAFYSITRVLPPYLHPLVFIYWSQAKLLRYIRWIR